jgi:hypothetical protein
MRGRIVGGGVQFSGNPGARDVNVEELVIGGYPIRLERAWDSLHDAAGALGVTALERGGTKVWYLKGDAEGFDPRRPLTASDLFATHALLGAVACRDPEVLRLALREESWSPSGEAQALVAGVAAGRTKVGIAPGDVVQIGGELAILAPESGWVRSTVVPDGVVEGHLDLVRSLASLDEAGLVAGAARQKYKMEVATLTVGDGAAFSANLRACLLEADRRGLPLDVFERAVTERYAATLTRGGLPKVDPQYLINLARGVARGLEGVIGGAVLGALARASVEAEFRGDPAFLCGPLEALATALEGRAGDRAAQPRSRAARALANGIRLFGSVR